MVRVGCCGWCIKGGKKEYFKVFDTVEIQETFYRLPRVETVKKWREDAPFEFTFNMKAWQVITHPSKSPTWRRSGLRISKSKAELYGSLKPSRENIEAWAETCKVAEALNAKIIVFQTPASFNYSDENISNIVGFFSTVERGKSLIGWEPRGDWREHLDEVKKLCSKLDILHVTDPFRSENVSNHPIGYFRLHGIGGKEANYSYRYTLDDLNRLLKIIEREEREGRVEVYVMFNNISMKDDAINFKKLLLKTL
ncbi:MAG: DUF72 domain-containing protein [Candidatus Caldarchaeales archaeon]